MPTFNINQTVYLTSYNAEKGQVMEKCGFSFFRISAGFVEITSNGVNLTLHPDEMLFIPKNTIMEIKFPDSDDKIRYYSADFRFFPDVDSFEYDTQILKLSPEANNYYSKLIFDEWPLSCATLGNFFLFLSETILLLKKRFFSEREKQIYKVLEYMDKNDVYDIPILAKLARMSESRFYANFKLVTGVTPIEKKHEKQALKAEILLATTDLTIEEVCNKVGFNSMRHFREVIRKRYDMTPAQLKKNRKNFVHFNLEQC